MRDCRNELEFPFRTPHKQRTRVLGFSLCKRGALHFWLHPFPAAHRRMVCSTDQNTHSRPTAPIAHSDNNTFEDANSPPRSPLGIQRKECGSALLLCPGTPSCRFHLSLHPPAPFRLFSKGMGKRSAKPPGPWALGGVLSLRAVRIAGSILELMCDPAFNKVSPRCSSFAF